MNDATDIKQLTQSAEQTWNNLYHKPDINDYGLLTHSDGSETVGRGTNVFVWFESKQAMEDFIVTTLPFSPSGPEDSDPLAVQAEIKTLIEQAEAGKLEQLELRTQINHALTNYSQINWWGTLRDLLYADHPCSKKIRRDFRHSHTDSLRDDPVADDEMDKFIEYLSSSTI
jgi:hypothetical protein